MSDRPERITGAAELLAVWVMVGILGIVLHLPLTIGVLVAIALLWIVVAILLVRRSTAARLLDAWRGALATRAGGFGAATLLFAVMATAVIVSPGAGVLLAMLFMAGASLIGVWRGPTGLREQLAGWSLIVAMTGGGLLLAEAILRIDRVAAQVGTPIEIDSWWQRYDPVWERNVLAIRSPYETLRKEPGVVRIVALGDSFTWGDKIASIDSTWPAQLEQELRNRLAEPDVEVINLGQKGYTTVNEAESLRRIGWQFDPDVIVVQFYLNDILPSGPNFERGYSGWIFPRAWVLPERYKTGPAGRSALLHVIESVLSGRRHGDRVAQAARWTEVYQRRGPEWADLASAIEEMGKAAAERNVPIVLMLFPDFIPGMSETDVPFQAIHDQVTEVARSAGYSILDLTAHFMRTNPDMRGWWATPYDTHPNAAAAALAAETLSTHLIDIIEPAVWAGSTGSKGQDP